MSGENVVVGLRARLLERQAAHVRAVLSPGTSNAALVARARTVGRVHALAGAELDWYVDAVADLHEAHDRVHLSTLSGRGSDQHRMRRLRLVSQLGDEG